MLNPGGNETEGWWRELDPAFLRSSEEKGCFLIRLTKAAGGLALWKTQGEWPGNQQPPPLLAGYSLLLPPHSTALSCHPPFLSLVLLLSLVTVSIGTVWFGGGGSVYTLDVLA